jgi:hypothetical protein
VVSFEGWRDGHIVGDPVQQAISQDGFIDVLLNFSTIDELKIIVVEAEGEFYGLSVGSWSIDDMLFEVQPTIV